jgi:hypothetical protein
VPKALAEMVVIQRKNFGMVSKMANAYREILLWRFVVISIPVVGILGSQLLLTLILVLVLELGHLDIGSMVM